MKKRTISSIIILLIITPLLIIGKIPYAIGVGLVSLIAFREIMMLKQPEEKRLSLPLYGLNLIAFLILVFSNYDGNSLLFGLDYDLMGFTILLVLLPIIFIPSKNYGITRALRNLGLILLVGLGFNLLILVFNYDKRIFIYLVSVTIFTDIFAFISGSLIGKHKCAKEISPNKSWEGSIIGSIMGTFLATVVYINIIGYNDHMIRFILITLLLSVIGQLGDLFFSAIKREFKIKDFSNLIPGHGGILDRLDSLIFVLIGFLIFRLFL